MKIAIRFGDNDFYNTFIPLLNIIKDAYLKNNTFTEDKNKLCFIIRELASITYLTHQNHYDYNGLDKIENGLETGSHKEIIFIKKYFNKKITPDRILVNDEVDKYIEKCEGGDNGDTYILEINPHREEDSYAYSI
ncbi:MAG: hypothetical protein AABY32_01365 [Nanoarchaeota archaeon]